MASLKKQLLQSNSKSTRAPRVSFSGHAVQSDGSVAATVVKVSFSFFCRWKYVQKNHPLLYFYIHPNPYLRMRNHYFALKANISLFVARTLIWSKMNLLYLYDLETIILPSFTVFLRFLFMTSFRPNIVLWEIYTY